MVFADLSQKHGGRCLKGIRKETAALVGVGFHAVLESKDLVLNLDFSHPFQMTIPEGFEGEGGGNTRISVSGYDKHAIGEFAAAVRKWRPPEPYDMQTKMGKLGKKLGRRRTEY